MKNENIIVKFTAFVLLLTMIVLCLVSGTFAKYTSYFTAEDMAVVAKWDVADGDIEGTFDIFKSSKIYDTKDANYAAGDADTDVFQVEAGTDEPEQDGKIAPGTWGSFTYQLTNKSEVTVNYDVAYTAVEADVPLVWSLNPEDGWVDDVEELNVNETFTGDTKDITLYWQWAFEDGTDATDEADTALGATLDEDITPMITLEVTFTQVD